ncbi:acetyl-CoA carboxylase, biotin carboxyl carrier protein [candidate division WOR-3 bacterium RBG_13_43_14]|uniref:Biotin carboxyl carrier protein of acetyl-CoA carboxylase n=1 Tax=candidate division WOR-3 bacterium RBG_13_43_14 TaxID=1802590 RepID=A0A1F4U341_UNCW3|nr:MAG: acetyl-CoA carboxylase, biotin carboxyl carrier protein [candidate division WOR-3 bacterium RBG_13_43_14]
MRIKEIEKILKLIENSVVNEIEICDFWGRRVRVSKNAAVCNPNQTASAPITKIPETKTDPVSIEAKPAASKNNFVPIKSPIVGTFYRASAPDAPPYVEVGDIVKPGQAVCIIEAMKLMNEIEADIAGRIIEVLVKNESPVEYNQELFLIEPLK